MESASPSATPPGWYPDPSGQRQWRVWTGDRWSELTKSYGESVAVTGLGGSFELVRALHRVARFGVTGFYAGIALIVGISAHWPGTAHPSARWFATTTLDAGIVLVTIGLAFIAFSVRELEGRWTPLALLPVVNVIALGALVTRRLSGPVARRAISETVLLVLFIYEFRLQPWLAVAPAVLALGLIQSTTTLIDQLSVSTSTPPSIAP